MPTEVIQSFISQVLTFVGGIMVAYGWFDSATATQVVGAVSTIVSVIWSYVTHTKITSSGS